MEEALLGVGGPPPRCTTPLRRRAEPLGRVRAPVRSEGDPVRGVADPVLRCNGAVQRQKVPLPQLNAPLPQCKVLPPQHRTPLQQHKIPVLGVSDPPLCPAEALLRSRAAVRCACGPDLCVAAAVPCVPSAEFYVASPVRRVLAAVHRVSGGVLRVVTPVRSVPEPVICVVRAVIGSAAGGFCVHWPVHRTGSQNSRSFGVVRGSDGRRCASEVPLRRCRRVLPASGEAVLCCGLPVLRRDDGTLRGARRENRWMTHWVNPGRNRAGSFLVLSPGCPASRS